MSEKQTPTAAAADLISALVEIVPAALAVVDRSYRVVYANDAAALQVGFPKRELTGMTLDEVLPDSWPDQKEIFDRVLAGETILNVDVDLSERLPEQREWMASYYPVTDGDGGEVTAVACTSIDVTEFRENQRSLGVRNDLFAMLALVNAAVSRHTSKQELFNEICEIAHNTGNFRYAWIGEPRDGAITGIANAGDDGGYMRALDASGLMITTDPTDKRSQGPTGQAYLLDEVSVVNDYFSSPTTEIWRDAAREVGFQAAAAFPIHEHGEVIAVLSLYADQKNYFNDERVETLAEITPVLSQAMDRFALERVRHQNEEELRLRDRALTAATQGVVITDARAEDQPVIYLTPAFEELTGYSSEEFLGRNCRILQGPDTDLDAVKRVHNAIAAGEPCEVEMLNYRKDGEPFWNRLAISPIFDDSGDLTHFVGVQTDVTERRTLENQVRQAQQMEAVGQLAGGVAHDFNNALTVIRGSVDLALAEEPSDRVREDLQQIDEAAEHATNLTQQLLAFSKQQVLQPQSTNLNAVLTETISLVARVIGDNVELVTDLDGDIDAVLVDRAQLQQVILNLAINARDAMPDGGTITIATTACDLDDTYVENRLIPKAGRYVRIEISDNGEGMDEATKARVFEPFFTTKTEGTGLGLATVYGIVSQTGGLIELVSEPNLGTTFKIYLPTTDQAVAPRSVGADLKRDELDGDETILHVEDSEMLRPLVARTLRGRGYNVLSAENAEEAIELAKTHAGEIDLVLTDIVMPGLNGRELAEILTAMYPELKVVFTSGYPADMVIRQGIAAAEVNFIEKPFVAKDLLPLVRGVLDRSSSELV